MCAYPPSDQGAETEPIAALSAGFRNAELDGERPAARREGSSDGPICDHFAWNNRVPTELHGNSRLMDVRKHTVLCFTSDILGFPPFPLRSGSRPDGEWGALVDEGRQSMQWDALGPGGSAVEPGSQPVMDGRDADERRARL